MDHCTTRATRSKARVVNSSISIHSGSRSPLELIVLDYYDYCAS